MLITELTRIDRAIEIKAPADRVWMQTYVEKAC